MNDLVCDHLKQLSEQLLRQAVQHDERAASLRDELRDVEKLASEKREFASDACAALTRLQQPFSDPRVGGVKAE